MGLGRRKVAALAAGAIAVAGISAGAVAATGGGSGESASDLAAAINKRAGTSITADEVTGALTDLLKERLAADVAAGRLTQAQADEILQRAQTAPNGLPGIFGGPGERGYHHAFHGPGTVFAKVAKKLGMTEQALHDQLESGKTLAQVAKAKGVTRAELIATISAALKADGVPAARVADLAAHIADDADGPGHHGPGGGGPRP